MELRNVDNYFSESLQSKYEFYDCYFAYDILKVSHSSELKEFEEALENVGLEFNDVIAKGGNKSPIVKKFDSQFYSQVNPENPWHETKITADLYVTLKYAGVRKPELNVTNDYLSGYKLDYFKNRVAIDLEWNSKDQTFDRDLTAYRACFEHEQIDLGIIITRNEELKDLWKDAARIKKKSGASTTWIGKLIGRAKSDRAGRCPILVVAIKPSCIAGY